MSFTSKPIIIIGAGPAGLTAAIELIEHEIGKPIVLETDNQVGGIAKTFNYKGNRMDIGGHRFFSKSEVVMKWWLKYLPLQTVGLNLNQIESSNFQSFSNQHNPIEIDPNISDRVMLIRNRLSRIFYLRKFFKYPISISVETISNIGFIRISNAGFSYIWAKLFPIKEEKSLEDFFINRFGKVLYKTFFKDYTEKVWGIECSKISAEWGSQRIKGLNIGKALLHALKFNRKRDIAQKKVETSLIDTFLYPKLGPGQLWEIVADETVKKGGEIHLNSKVESINVEGNRITSVVYANALNEKIEIEGSYFFSTMPIKDLILSMNPAPSERIRNIASGLLYRDFITVGLLVKRFNPKMGSKIEDNWIYIQEPDVKIGRLQVFNNWSPYLVADSDNIWLGLEYFCQDTDEMWQLSEDEMKQFAIDEMIKMGFVTTEDVLDGCVLKVPKTYPAYFGTYDQFPELIDFLNSIENLYCIGRNGMHRYNNQDHSMLTAIEAVKNIANGNPDKSHIWKINTEKEYHEEKS